MKKILLFAFSLCYTIQYSFAQFNLQPWRGKKCAIVLTYDDALNVHLDNAIPLLDSLSLKATFYLTANSPGFKNRMEDWKAASKKAYELGNHTLFHPCIGGTAGRSWVKPEYDMNNYTIRRMVDEIRLNNVILEAIDGQKKRTFAFTCGDMKVSDGTFTNDIKTDFTAARAVRHEMHKINEIDLMNVDCYAFNGESGDQMIELAKKAMETNSLLVVLFHGVGGEHNINVSLEAHHKFLQYIKANEKDIMVATMLETADHIKDWQARDKIRKQTDADHKDMLSQLGITTLRQGANGNDPKASNAANYDEAKANPYPNLPNPLLFKNGKKVTNVKQWSMRKTEIREDFDREIYGRVPANTPKVNWEVIHSTDTVLFLSYPVTLKKLIGHVDNSSYPSITVDIQLTYATPSNTKMKVPLIMEFGFVFPPGFRFPNPPTNNNIAPDKPWQQQCLEKGWGYAQLIPTTIQADHGAGLTQGIIGLMNKGQHRKPDDWGSLRAWAWGASRALDYFETTNTIDAKKVAIEGHSRYGKAALVTLAYDERFATGFISSSGEGGAKLHRRNAGEIVENLTGSGEYHWMAGNFIKYGGPKKWGDLPVDSHELIALCAPRPVFISSGNVGDAWVDVRGMFMSAVAAGPVYRLLGKKDLGTTEFPKVEQGLMDGEIAYRQHNGGHTPGPNWPVFLAWADRYFK